METIKTALTLDFSKPFSMELSRGDVSIAALDDKPSLTMEYTPFGSIKPEIDISPDGANSITFKNSEIVKTNVRLNVPKDSKSISVHVISGTISVTGIKGSFNLQSDGGDIKAAGCKGSMSATAFNGDIKINGHNGRLDLNANTGNIKIIGWASASGNILCANGRVLAGLNDVSDGIKINSNNGDISLGLSANTSCKITARAAEIINYLDDPLNGKKLGSIASVEHKNGMVNIEAFSSNRRVFIAKNEDLRDISPDMEEILNDLESSFRQGFDSFAKSMDTFGKKISRTIGGLFAENLKKPGTNNKEKPVNDSSKNERMEILQMLKDGKITAEEAEKLLKALK